MKKFTWIVKITVDKTWVEDGFDLTNDRANSMVRNDLQFASSLEVKARVLQAPPKREIRKVQGYRVRKVKK